MAKMICSNCNISENLENLNNREDAKLYMAELPKTRSSDGLEIYPLICFECELVTDFAADPHNSSGNAKDGFEFFSSYKIDEDLKRKIADYALQNNNIDAFTKILSIKT
tara:strand:+ start:26 stop:352 length:327 start_codon:yes stop_codon:yes gene_type:complete